ncbi:MAG TPA: CDP-diacylglycerol diphosphatase [Rhodopila sp.]|uniref:CDP-diacylglycerol diphosphatase n=1 Tax=Rhodopila sp. TaxID=2480087 RepID=UPI002B7173F0|nr:CDP-diacylglycerol diphosphatase [Rhodopila sp.]HVY17444.1 CDP-diacylglycerol diphosphatase [Rhodopila sp.]
MKRVLLACVLAGSFLPAGARASDPSALWKIVSQKCVPHQQADHDPSPCALVDIRDGVAKGYVLLKDIAGIAQFLLIPTARISGIEDPAVLAPGATNYFEAAWKERHFVDERLHAPVPRDAMTLAINSVYGRTQDQLHIHIDCIRVDVRASIGANLDKVGDDWAPFPVLLAGHHYRAIRIDGKTLADANPFRLLVDKDPQAAKEMDKHTLVVAGETFRPGDDGFVLLDGKADAATGNAGSGEELQDHACKVMGE